MSESNTTLHEYRRVYSAAARMLRIEACPPAAAVAEAGPRGRVDLPMEATLDVSDVHRIRKGTALLFATSTRPALVGLKPWFRSPGAKAISIDQSAEESAIPERAARKLAL